MGRKRRLCCIILTFSILVGCSVKEESFPNLTKDTNTIRLSLKCPCYASRGESAIDERINDISLVIFDDGEIEKHIWTGDIEDSEVDLTVDLTNGHSYSFFAAANIGKKLNISFQDELEKTLIDFGEDSHFSNGIPMTCSVEDIYIDNDMNIDLELERLASKISLKIDRGHLSEDIKFEVRNLKIGNWPRYAYLFGTNRVSTRYDCLSSGYELNESECAPLNYIGHKGISGEVSLYMIENMQGDFPHKIQEDEEKILDEDSPLSDVCSYIEMEIFYESEELISYDSNLIYRFYLGDSRENLDVERNCHYHITVTPEDDGLSGSGWRVDKSGIGPSVPTFKIMPGDFVEGHVGEEIHIWCDYYPKSTPVTIGYEELDYDKGKGIYDYVIDEDGCGFTLYLRNPGSGLVYMSAGEPINKKETVIISVLP